MIRTSVRSGAGWVFGLAATVLFISLWGRAVIVDTDALAEAAAPLSESPAVAGMVSSWLEDELADYGLPSDQVGPLIDYVMETSAAAEAVDRLVSEVVFAASDPTVASVDVASVLLPAVPQMAETLSAAGVEIPTQEVSAVVARLDPLQIREPGATPYIGPQSSVAGRFGTAALLAVSVMVAAATVAIGVSADRIGETRRLLTRLALGGLSFGILLRLGSWILDPGGGRAPIEESVSLVMSSQWLVPMTVAGVAAALAGAVWVVGRVVRPGAMSPTPAESARQQSMQLL